MNQAMDKLAAIKTDSPLYQRAFLQLEFARQLSLTKGNIYDALIVECVDLLCADAAEQGAVTKAAVEACEAKLAPLSAQAKGMTLMFASHAHIDMNWMWNYAETVAITLDTFRTMLGFMDIYPDFTFAQSQASTYRIVEEYDPVMLAEIKRRIHEGRWEVIASHWVEADKNMSGSEAQVRHLLETKKYLSKLFDIDPDTLNLDYEPDTFGHSRFVPEVLSRGGVKYYYHMRGMQEHDYLYRFCAPSGAEVIAMREPQCYTGPVDERLGALVPWFCDKYGIDTYLSVFGVGDHGGGPTQKDIEKIHEMDTWPCWPNCKFGSYREFFAKVEAVRDNLPRYDREQNFIFTGCYTTQARIKEANRRGEQRLVQAEIYSVMAGQKPMVNLSPYWQNVLFNQFHDILPGSGVIDTREHAMGIFNQSLAAANQTIAGSARTLAGYIDTMGLLPESTDPADRGQGGGVGWGVSRLHMSPSDVHQRIPAAERGQGIERIYHIFNGTAVDANRNVELTVWDWPGDMDRMQWQDDKGNDVAFQILERDGGFWAHKRCRVLVRTTIPALGYTTVKLRQALPKNDLLEYWDHERTHNPIVPVLENAKVKVTFDPTTYTITSLIDKTTGTELCRPGAPMGEFRLITEQGNGMSAWVIDRYMAVESLHQKVRKIELRQGEGLLEQYLEVKLERGKTELTITYRLPRDAAYLDVVAHVDWQQIGDHEQIPQCNVIFPFGYQAEGYRYAVPNGFVDRAERNDDVPACGLGMAINPYGPQLCLQTQTKYGYRAFENSIALDLIRSGHNPDKYPECYEHTIPFRLWVVPQGTDNLALFDAQFAYENPPYAISGTRQTGAWPTTGQRMQVHGAALQAVKFADDGRTIVRLLEVDGKHTTAKIHLPRPAKASLCDLLENPLNSLAEGNVIDVPMAPYTLVTVALEE